MTQQVMDEMGITQADLDDQTDEGYALLEEFINKLSERGGEYQKYIKDIDIPDTFNLHLDITKVRGLEANYQWSEEDEKNMEGMLATTNMKVTGASISRLR